MEQDDQILLNELAAGNHSAYELVFKKYYKMLVTKAYFMLNDEMAAEDVVQNIFVTLWQKSLLSSVQSSLKSYLYAAVHNQCLMIIRNQKVEDRRMSAYTATVEQEYEEESRHLGHLETTESRDGFRTVDQLDLLFNELPLQRQKAFKLVYLEDKKYKQAAEEMGLSVNSVKTHLKLAVKTLKEKITKFK